MTTAGITARRPQVDKASLAQLAPNPSVRYTAKALYDTLMALEVPTTNGDCATIKVKNYLNTTTTPGKDANGGEGFVVFKRELAKVARLRGNKWVLPVDVASPILDLAQFGSSVFSGFARSTPAYLTPVSSPTSLSPSYFPMVMSEPGSSKKEALEVDNWELWRFFCGKASPPEIRRALFLAQAAGLAAPTEEGVQAYCNAQGGMDCSGFASVCYGYELIKNQGYNATQFQSRGSQRSTISEIQAGDAIVWLLTNHIAVVQQVTADADGKKVTCKVGESTEGLVTLSGPGVQYSDYVFEADSKAPDPTRKYRMLRPKSAGGYSTWKSNQITVRGNP